MSKAQLVITAVVLEGRSKTAVARDYDVSRQWVHQLVARYQAQGAAAFEPRSRRPHTNAHAISPELEERIVRLRKTLDKAGYDAGAATIAEHLARDPDVTKVPALSTIWRILTRRGFVSPQPHKRPRSAWKRFTADQPNQLWQADVTHWRLADNTEVEILNILDDHSRVALASLARPTITGPDVLDTFLATFTRWGTPAAVLTDNGAIFTATPRRGGRSALQVTLGELGINYINSRPYHPQTCGKVERPGPGYPAGVSGTGRGYGRRVDHGHRPESGAEVSGSVGFPQQFVLCAGVAAGGAAALATVCWSRQGQLGRAGRSTFGGVDHRD